MLLGFPNDAVDTVTFCCQLAGKVTSNFAGATEDKRCYHFDRCYNWFTGRWLLETSTAVDWSLIVSNVKLTCHTCTLWMKPSMLPMTSAQLGLLCHRTDLCRTPQFRRQRARGQSMSHEDSVCTACFFLPLLATPAKRLSLRDRSSCDKLSCRCPESRLIPRTIASTQFRGEMSVFQVRY